MPVRSDPALGLGRPATAQLPAQHPRLQCSVEARAGHAAAAQAPRVGLLPRLLEGGGAGLREKPSLPFGVIVISVYHQGP